MKLYYGERVVIDFDIDKLNPDNPPMFGYITEIIEEDNLNPGTLVKRVCYKAIGDDGLEYVSIDTIYGKPLFHTFYSKLHTIQMLLERTNDIQTELEILQQYEQLMTEAVTRRLTRGQSPTDIMKRYNTFAKQLLDEVKKAADTTEYFQDMMLKEFDKTRF